MTMHAIVVQFLATILSPFRIYHVQSPVLAWLATVLMLNEPKRNHLAVIHQGMV